MKRLFVLLLWISFSIVANAGQVWNIIPDFPKADPFPTTLPINGWTWGYHCVQAPHWSLTPDTDYAFDTFIDASGGTGYYILRGAGLTTTPDVRININSTWGPNGIRPYGSPGCVAMRPHYGLLDEGSEDDHIVDTYVQWISPADGYYDINLGVYYTTGNNEVDVTISINGQPVTGFDHVLSSQEPSCQLFGSALAAGDIVRMTLHGISEGNNMAPIYADIAQTSEPACWDVENDFPGDSNLFFPHHGWALGTDCVKTNWPGLTGGESYDYDIFVDTGNDYILRGPSASFAPEARLISYAHSPNLVLKTRLQTNSSGVVINDYSSYITWTAPISGAYSMELSANSTAYNTKVSFSINGEIINGVSDANSLNTHVGTYLFGHPMEAGDVLKITVGNDYNLAQASINLQCPVEVMAHICLDDAPEIVEDFEDGDISDWTVSDPQVELTNDISRSGTLALAATAGSNDFARAFKTFFDYDTRNVKLAAHLYKKDGSYQAKGAYIRLNSTDGSYILTHINHANHLRYATDQMPSSTGWQKPDSVLYDTVGAGEGWNTFEAVFDDEGAVNLFFNDLFITKYDGVTGLHELELGIAYDPNSLPVFDDIVITPADGVGASGGLDDETVHLAADLDDDADVDMTDLGILTGHWLNDSSEDFTAGIFDSMEYHNFTTAAVNGWSTFQGIGIVTDKQARSGHESLMIPKGAFGRIGKMFNEYPTDCTVSAWIYLPAVSDPNLPYDPNYTGDYSEIDFPNTTEVDLLDSAYSASNYIRVAAFNSDSGHNVKTTIGDSAWTSHPSASMIDGWNKVSFVVSSADTKIYFNDLLLRSVSASIFDNFKLLSIGKGGWHDTACPVDGEVIFDDVSVFASTTLSGEADVIFSDYETDGKTGINLDDFVVLAEQWNLSANADSPGYVVDDKQYVVANFAATGATGINLKTFDDFVRKLPNDMSISRNIGISREFRCIDNDPCDPAARAYISSRLQEFMDFSETYNIPIVIHFDLEQWWGNRPDLWNWWDPTMEGYDPANVENVEWYGWGSAYATKIAWRNWGSQSRRSPAPNLMSPTYRQQCHLVLDAYVPLIMDWYNALPNYKKHLLLGFKLGGETTIGINAFYYPNGNDYLETWPEDDSHDPTYGLTASAPPNYGVQQIGYAALTHSGLKTSGTITESDIAQVIGVHLSDLAQYAYNLGLPKEKMFTSCWRYEAAGTNTLAAVNNYSGPGWSYYTDEATDQITDSADISQAIANRATAHWAINEGYLSGEQTMTDWETFLDGNLQPGCKYLNLYNWHAFMDDPEILTAIINVLEN